MKKLGFDLRTYLAIAACSWQLSAPGQGFSDSHDYGDDGYFSNLSDYDGLWQPPRKSKQIKRTRVQADRRPASRRSKISGRGNKSAIRSGTKLLSLLPSDQKASVTRLLAATRNNPDNRNLCGRSLSYSASSPQAAAEGRYRYLAQQLNCSSKLPSVKTLSLVSKMPDGMCCVFDGGWERNGGYLVRGQKFYGSDGGANYLQQQERQCGQNRGRWFVWNGDILTNTNPGDMFPYGRRIATAGGGEVWEPVDFKGLNGDPWLATAEPECPKRTISPLIVDFGGSGVPLSDPKNGVSFDLTARGNSDRISWPVDHRSMFLVLDKGEGPSSFPSIDGSALFGNYSPGPDGRLADNGFLALAKYDANRDGSVDEKDAVFRRLRLWSDANRNGLAETSELLSIRDAGVLTISLSYEPLNQGDEFGNAKAQVGYLTLANGDTRKIYDVWFAVGTGVAVHPPAAIENAESWQLQRLLTVGWNYFLKDAQ